MEESQVLMEKEADDETRPYQQKYEAREILRKLLKNKYLQPTASGSSEEESQVLNCTKALIKHKLGLNLFDCEEYSDSEKTLKEALELFDSVPDTIKVRFFNNIQDIYNNLGIIHCNRDTQDKGIPYFVKAEQIYKLVTDSKNNATLPNTSFANDFD